VDGDQHLALSLPAAGALYLATASAPAALAFAVGGVLIDLDHLIDFFRETGWFNTDVKRFLAYFEAREPVHTFLGLHAWEWPLQFIPAALILGAPAWAWGLAAGILVHLILDQRYNRLQPWAYSFLYRWAHRFDSWSFY
jgi:hypothetical protein